MELKQIGTKDVDSIAPLLAAFRVQLKSYKGIQSKPNVEAAKTNYQMSTPKREKNRDEHIMK